MWSKKIKNIRKINIFVLMGLPGSGKTTWAQNKAKEENTIIVSRDDLRYAIEHDYVHKKENVELIWDVSQYLLKVALTQNFNVIIDQLSLQKEKREETFKTIRKFAPKSFIHVIHFTETENNVQRRLNSDMRWGDKEYYEKIIKKMKKTYEKISYGEDFDSLWRINGEGKVYFYMRNIKEK